MHGEQRGAARCGKLRAEPRRKHARPWPGGVRISPARSYASRRKRMDRPVAKLLFQHPFSGSFGRGTIDLRSVPPALGPEYLALEQRQPGRAWVEDLVRAGHDRAALAFGRHLRGLCGAWDGILRRGERSEAPAGWYHFIGKNTRSRTGLAAAAAGRRGRSWMQKVAGDVRPWLRSGRASGGACTGMLRAWLPGLAWDPGPTTEVGPVQRATKVGLERRACRISAASTGPIRRRPRRLRAGVAPPRRSQDRRQTFTRALTWAG